MKAVQMLVIGMIFGLALLLASYLGADKNSIAGLTAMFGGIIPVLAMNQNRRGASCCWFRKIKPADPTSV